MTKIVTEVKISNKCENYKNKSQNQNIYIKSKNDKIFKNKKYLKLITINQKTKTTIFFNLNKIS